MDGRNILEFSLKRLRSQVYHVTSAPVIFNASIKENISFGRKELSDEQIYRAALLAQATSFIEDAEPDRERRAQSIKVRLRETITDLSRSFKQLEGLDQEIGQLGDIDLRQLLLEALSYGDLQTYLQISADPMSFLAFAVKAFTETSSDSGLNWIDLLLMHEWNQELEVV